MCNPWQPIATVPKDGTVVDLWVPGHGRITDEWWDDGWSMPAGEEWQPTHWMIAPEPEDDQ
jgi:hypothetical protein